MRRKPFVILLALAAAMPAAADAKVLEPVEDAAYTIKQPLDPGSYGEDDPDEAHDISGIACLPLEDGKARHCLVVNDEGRIAQAVTIKDRTLKPQETIKLVRKSTAGQTLGRPPKKGDCTGADDKAEATDEFDGEGVAYAAGHFYVVGSHGCGRKKGTFKLSSMRLARIPVDGKGRAGEDGIRTTFRLADALAAAPRVKDFFLKPLDKQQNGLNVEGVAVIGETLYAGLRAPSLARDGNEWGEAFLIDVPLKYLFAEGEDPVIKAIRTIPLKVGTGAGIRDLATLGRGRLLVLTGPAQDQNDVPYSLLIADPETGKTTPLGDLAEFKGKDRGGKAEAVVHLGGNRVLVLFDSLASGGPREYEVDLGP